MSLADGTRREWKEFDRTEERWNMPDAHTALIERLERATEGSQELADEVLLACGWTVERRHPELLADWWSPQTKRYVELNRPDPTTSIDAAMTLFKSRDGYGALHMFWFEGSKGATVKAFPFDDADEADMIRVTARTLPLAICIAALRARQTKED